MQPQHPYQQPQQNNPDYMDMVVQHMQPEPQPTGFDKKTKLFLIIAGIICVLLLIFIVVMTQAQKNSIVTPVPLAARLQTLDKISTDYHQKLRATALQDANSSLRVVLKTANTAITEPLESYGIDPKKINAESADELTKALDEAHLNTTLDTVYVREMAFQLEETRILMERLLGTVQTQSMKDFLEATIKDFESLNKRLTGSIATSID